MQTARRRLCAGLALASIGVPCLAASGASAVAGERKVALVIGNSAYRVGVLKNPVNDAQAVAASLRDLIESFRQFSLSTRSASVRVVYYAGHGLQLKGRNYLLPVDTEIRGEDEVVAKSADLNELLDRLGATKQGINIVILDACRNNPFSGVELVGPDGRRLKFRGATPAGLAPVEAPLGSMVAFSTAPGGVALDNPGDKNSLYTKHLLISMQSPGLPVELLFKQVRLGVARETGRVQVPWESSSLTGEFCFIRDTNGSCNSGR
jgi:carboxyl-terminal processing protease